MAAWKRTGGLEKFEGRLIAGMLERGYAQEFADAIFRQIQGFAEYGFPESHAASFALLAYVSSWLKCHEPEAFLAALLNSQPMGFYAPSQLVQDARRHQVEVLPADVTASDWDAALAPGGQSPRPAVRLGLNLVRGLSREAAWRIEEARAIRPYTDVQDLALRAQLERTDLQALAAANALSALSGNRRQALWQALAGAPDKGLLRHAPVAEPAPLLAAPSEAQDIAGDYRSMGLTLGRHPVALLRQRLLAKRFMPADVLHTYANGQFARGCGIVTVRQRPETAHGVLFVTLEDETGLVNVIVWPSLVEQQRREVLGAALLGVYGIWQNEQGVMHLVAKRLVDLSAWLGTVETRSRDFG